jgi:hypothetical protein
MAYLNDKSRQVAAARSCRMTGKRPRHHHGGTSLTLGAAKYILSTVVVYTTT